MKYCEEFAALLDLYVDGELSGEEAARVRAHLERCPGCQSYVDEALAIRAAFPEAEGTVVPEGFAEGVMAAVRTLENAKTSKTGPAGRRTVYWKKVLLPLAACFAIVLAVRHGPIRGGGSTSAASNDAAPAAMDCAAPSGGVDNAADAEMPAEAAPQMETGSEENGLEAAPAPRITADEPAASVDGVQELENTVMTTSGGQMPRTVYLTAAQAGELLADLPCTAGGDGVRRYRLTDGEFDALLEALAERDILPQEEEPLEADTVDRGYCLVYVTEE